MSRYIDADKLLELYDYQELNEMINAYARKGVDKEKWNIPIGVVKQNIKDMPTADVRENVKGRWVEVVDRTEMYDKEGVKTWGMLFQCNQCGFVLNAIEGHTGQYNYCPNCGAQMIRGES